MEALNGKMNEIDDENLPPGFRFHPMDEELVTFYLTKKVVDSSFSCRAITEVDLNKCEPWDLPAKATMGEKEWYFFSLRDRKYPTGLRTNRATQAGYWKATGKDREIFKGRTNILVGMKKTLVFYKGRAPKGEKTNWVMHEYRLEGKFSYSNLRTAKDEWVVSRIFHKSSGAKKGQLGHSRSSNFLNDMDSPALPPLLESPYMPPNGLNNNEGGSSDSAGSAMDQQHVTCFSTPPTDSHHKLYNNNNNSSSSTQKGMRPHGSLSGEIDLSFLQNIMLGDQAYMNANPQALSGLRQTHDLQVNVAQQMSGAQHLPSFSMAPVSNFPHLFSHSSLPSGSMWRALFDQYPAGVGSNEMISGLKQCKMEPPSSSFSDKDMKLQVQSPWEASAAMQAKFIPISQAQPMVTMSQETGLTTEMNNTEISSVVSSQMNNNQHYADEDLDCFWPLP